MSVTKMIVEIAAGIFILFCVLFLIGLSPAPAPRRKPEPDPIRWRHVAYGLAFVLVGLPLMAGVFDKVFS